MFVINIINLPEGVNVIIKRNLSSFEFYLNKNLDFKSTDEALAYCRKAVCKKEASIMIGAFEN